MAKRVTQEDIILMNEIYCRVKTYAATARECGFSPSTVSKYIIKDYTPQSDRPKEKIIIELPNINDVKIIGTWAENTILSEEEWAELRELQKEVII